MKNSGEDFISVLKALGNEERLSVLVALAEKPQTSDQLVTATGLPLKGVFRGLHALMRVNLVGKKGFVNHQRERNHGGYIVYQLTSRVSVNGEEIAINASGFELALRMGNLSEKQETWRNVSAA